MLRARIPELPAILPVPCFVPGRLLADQVVGWPVEDSESEGSLTLAQRSATEIAVSATKSPMAVLEPYPPFMHESSPCRSALSALSLSSDCQEPMGKWQNSQSSDPQVLPLNSWA